MGRTSTGSDGAVGISLGDGTMQKAQASAVAAGNSATEPDAMSHALEVAVATKRALIEMNVRMADEEKRGKDGTPFLDSVLDDALIFRRANGQVVGKAEYLEGLANPGNTYEYLRADAVEVALYEDTAVVSLRIAAKGVRAGQEFEGIFRNTRLFLYRKDGWRCALWFNTLAQS